MVEGFAKIAAPLYDLTKKRAKFQWTEECDVAFQTLKTVLTSAPVVGMPNDSDLFTLDTDASDESIGAVLSQCQNGREVVIAYASRRLSKSEKNYCVTRRELLAVVAFLKHFRHYLLGRKFVIRTDHAALTWLRKVSEPIGQQARWLEQLEEYDFQIVHRAGIKHGNADSLSRKPCDKTRCCRSVPDDNGNEFVCRAIGIATEEASETTEDWSSEVLAKCQEEDTDIGPIRNLLLTDNEKPDWDVVAGLSASAKTLWRQWDRLRIFRGVLMRRFEHPDGRLDRLQVIMPASKREEFVQLVHSGATGGHLGQRRTKFQVQLRAYWPGWSTDVIRSLNRCAPCAQYHRGKAPKQTPLKPFVAGEPWEVVSIDITGPHPRSRRGHEYILTIVDHFSKWAEALPIRNHTAQTVSRVLFDNVFSRMGMPKRCLSDQGAEFESNMFQQLCARMGIDKVRTTPYHPSTNSVVERFHRTLNSMLAKVVSVNQKDWCEHLPTVMAAYRASVHESTQFTPNRLIFGKENRMPVDLVLGDLEGGESNLAGCTDEYAAGIVERQQADYALVREHLDESATRRKEQYDIRVRSQEFVPGQLVWYHYPRRRQGLSPKWQSYYTGPYRIVRVIDSHTVVIQKNARSKCIVVHRDKLKACAAEPEPSSQPASGGNVRGSRNPIIPTNEDLILTKEDLNLSKEDLDRVERPRRAARKPAYLRDYCVRNVRFGRRHNN